MKWPWVIYLCTDFQQKKKGYDTRKNTKIYPNIYKYIQIYTRYTRYIQNGSGPGRAAAAWPPPGILYISCISCISLYIFGYIWIYFCIFSGVVTFFFLLEICTKINDPRPYVYFAARCVNDLESHEIRRNFNHSRVAVSNTVIGN